MANKLNPKLKYKTDMEEVEVPKIEFDLDSKPKKKSRVIIQNKNERKTRDTSTNNTRLF